MADKRNTWTQPTSPPPPLFVGKAERNFVKQINDEIVESSDPEKTNSNPEENK